MAPLDPDVTGRSNLLPLAILGGQGALVVGLTTHILRTIYQAARSLPPSTETRAQNSIRKRNVAIFSTLGFLSLVSVTTFAVAWRLLSYFEWAEKGNVESPGGLWTGWYGTGEEGIGRWRLGDWWSDVDLIDDSYAKVLAAPESFMYLYQHFSGITAVSVFFGVEGRRRNLPISTIASFVALSAFGSLGLALNLFFITMLFTPLAVHDDQSHRHDALFAPKPSVFYAPVIGAFALEQCLPYLLARRSDLTLFRIAYLSIPMFLAFIPEFAPARWGRFYTSKAAAHHSYVKVFYVLGLTALFMTWKQVMTTYFVNVPKEPNWFGAGYDLFMNKIRKNHQQKPSRFMQGLENMVHGLKTVSTHPAIGVTAMDVGVTMFSLLVWTFVRQLDVSDILENSVLSFLNPKEKEKHVAFKEKVDAYESPEPEIEEVEEPVDEVPVTPRRRGRPRKNEVVPPATVPMTTTALPKLGNHTVTKDVPVDATGGMKLRRSTRQSAANLIRVDSDDSEDEYQPPVEEDSALEQTEIDGSPVPEDLIAGGESTALALVISFFGGLGQLAASVLGAEVTGSV